MKVRDLSSRHVCIKQARRHCQGANRVQLLFFFPQSATTATTATTVTTATTAPMALTARYDSRDNYGGHVQILSKVIAFESDGFNGHNGHDGLNGHDS